MSLLAGSKLLVRELLRNADVAALAANSFRNYHAVGLDYLCLLRTPNLTVKAYFFRGKDHAQARRGFGPDNWLVMPHNHRYSFEHLTLQGRIINRLFHVVEGLDHDIYSYDADKRQPRRLLGVGLHEYKVSDATYFRMSPKEIHTLSIAPEEDAVALQIQYGDVQHHTAMFVPAGYIPQCQSGDLYWKAENYHVRDWVTHLKDLVGE